MEELEKMFSENVILRDWELYAEGKAEVLAANKKIFEAVESIFVLPIKLYQDENVITAELRITINNNETLLVTDVIVYDEDEQISAIRAYKGN